MEGVTAIDEENEEGLVNDVSGIAVGIIGLL